MDIEVRRCLPEEQRAAMITAEAAFLETANEEDFQRWGHVLDPDRMVIAVEDGRIVGTGGNITFDMTTPGRAVPAAGVTIIGVLPTHRRRGILRRMMAWLHDDAAERNEPVAILWASEAIIYQRFGYGMAIKDLRMNAGSSRTVFRGERPPGRFRLLTVEQARDALPPLYERVLPTIPGMYSRTAEWWKHHRLVDAEHLRRGRSELFCALLEVDGRPEGYALYRSKQIWDPLPRSEVHVIEALGTSPEAELAVWRFLFDIDLTEKVVSYWVPQDTALIHAVMEPTRLDLTLDDSVWLRIIDVEKALAGRLYAAADALVLDVEDPDRPRNHGRWRLDTTGDEVSIEKTEHAPDIRLGIADLGAIYLGGNLMRDLIRAGRGRELTPDAAARIDALFRSERAPFCPEVF